MRYMNILIGIMSFLLVHKKPDNFKAQTFQILKIRLFYYQFWIKAMLLIVPAK